MANEKGAKPQSVPLNFTEEQVKLAREGRSKQVFEEVLNPVEDEEPDTAERANRSKRGRSK